MLRGHTPVELLQVALHDAPHVLDLVGWAKVPVAMVAAFVRIAIELKIVVASMSIGQDEATSGDGTGQKQFQGVLCSVRDNLEAKPPGIPFNGTNDQGLVPVLLFAKEALVDLYDAGEFWQGRWQVLPEAPVPPANGRVADANDQTGSIWALAILETPE